MIFHSFFGVCHLRVIERGDVLDAPDHRLTGFHLHAFRKRGGVDIEQAHRHALVLAAAGLGLTFAVACHSRKQLEGLSSLVILVMSAVGGAWFPREVTPDWFQTVGLFTITAYAMDAFHGILWYGKGILPTAELDGIWPQLAALYGIGGALLLLSFRLFHRRFVLRA